MKKDFNTLLKQRILVADGAMGTMLQAAGLPPGHCLEEWNVSNPSLISEIHKQYLEAGADIIETNTLALISEIHKQYLEAGADIIETNTLGGSRYQLSHYGFGESVSLFNRKAAEIACSVCPEHKFVAGSIGPTGEFLQPVGTLSLEDMTAAFREQISALLEGGTDIIIIETMSDINEVCAAITATKDLDSTVPVIATMTFEKLPIGYRTMMGSTPRDMIDPLIEAGADVIGTNCGTGMEDMIEIIRQLREVTDFPLIAQANAGLPEIEGSRTVYKETPKERADLVREIISIGVNIIGGCCGTTPLHIQATSEMIKKLG
jgi:5-methyltetrahydrofolate--homocysteine methyltransferase